MTQEEILYKIKEADKEDIKVTPRQILHSFGCEKGTKYNVIKVKNSFKNMIWIK